MNAAPGQISAFDTRSTSVGAGPSLKLAVLGATGSVGRLIVTQALDAGHSVTALVQNMPAGGIDARATVVRGDATDPDSVDRAVAGSDAVLSALGHVNGSPDDVLATATRNIIAAMHSHHVHRLVVLAPPSVADAHDRPGLTYRLANVVMWTAKRSLARDHEVQAQLIESSDLEWTIVRGAKFTDGPATGRYLAGPITRKSGARISRADLAEFMLATVTQGSFLRSGPLVSQ
jgi:putative NADH-flavin reductase